MLRQRDCEVAGIAADVQNVLLLEILLLHHQQTGIVPNLQGEPTSSPLHWVSPSNRSTRWIDSRSS